MSAFDIGRLHARIANIAGQEVLYKIVPRIEQAYWLQQTDYQSGWMAGNAPFEADRALEDKVKAMEKDFDRALTTNPPAETRRVLRAVFTAVAKAMAK